MQACTDSHSGDAPPVFGGAHLTRLAGLEFIPKAILDQVDAVWHHADTSAANRGQSNAMLKQKSRKSADKVPAQPERQRANAP